MFGKIEPKVITKTEGNKDFLEPWGTHFTEGHLYVTDPKAHKVYAFGRKNFGLLRTIPCQEETEEPFPKGVTFNSKKDLFIVMSNLGEIHKFPDNEEKIKFGSSGSGPTQLKDPHGIAIGPQDEIIVADTENHRIQIFDIDGNHVRGFGKKGSQNGEFINPTCVAVCKSVIAVSDRDNHRIQFFNMDGTYKSHFGQFGTEPGKFNEPIGIAFDCQGNLIVVDSKNHRVQIFNQTGKLLHYFGDQNLFNLPTLVSVDPISRRIAVVDTKNKRVQVFPLE